MLRQLLGNPYFGKTQISAWDDAYETVLALAGEGIFAQAKAPNNIGRTQQKVRPKRNYVFQQASLFKSSRGQLRKTQPYGNLKIIPLAGRVFRAQKQSLSAFH